MSVDLPTPCMPRTPITVNSETSASAGTTSSRLSSSVALRSLRGPRIAAAAGAGAGAGTGAGAALLPAPGALPLLRSTAPGCAGAGCLLCVGCAAIDGTIAASVCTIQPTYNPPSMQRARAGCCGRARRRRCAPCARSRGPAPATAARQIQPFR